MTNREKNSICHKCKNFGHQKRNCPKNKTTYISSIHSPISSNLTSIYSNSYVKNMKEVEEFLLKCGKKSICLKFQHEDRLISMVGNFGQGKKQGNRKRIFMIDVVDGIAWGKHCRETFPEIASLDKISFDDTLTIINGSKIFVEISCNMYTLRWIDILQELEKVNKIKYTYIAEDKRSGCNLINYLEIDGHPVNHNAHADCITILERGQFYNLICDLYDRHKSPSYAKESVIYFIGMRKELPFPKDIVLLIAKELWKTRNDPIWCRKNISQLMNDRQSISILY